MTEAALAINAGSSSVKIGLFDIGPETPRLLAKGTIEQTDDRSSFHVVDATGRDLSRYWPTAAPAPAMVERLLEGVDTFLADSGKLVAVGHRIVHGGPTFVDPVRLTPASLDAIDGLTPLAPLHQPASIAPARAILRLRPSLPQVGCFDTAFHRTLHALVTRFAIPRQFDERGIRRYGFHGLSYEFIARTLREREPHLAAKRLVVAHLGSGASLCAMKDGESQDTTMGLTALDGLIMGTRCGSIDPGALLYLQQAEGVSLEQLEHMLYHESGLLGLSDLSNDVRTLARSDSPAARDALDHFTFRIARETAALANTLGGIDGLVFTGGIGEHAAGIRAEVCRRLRWLGVAIDGAANEANATVLDSATSAVAIRCIPTNEEATIAVHVRAALVSPR